MPLNKRELCRGDLKGGHPRHRHDEHGRPMLSGHYAYGRRGYVTWGTSSLNEDGSMNYCRGLWYSHLSPMEWSEISYEMSKKTEDWLRVERGDWFCRRPMPQFYETMPNDIWDGLNRRMYSLWERMEGIYEEDHPVFHSEIQKIFGLDKKDKAS